jgi:hypothetical protein
MRRIERVASIDWEKAKTGFEVRPKCCGKECERFFIWVAKLIGNRDVERRGPISGVNKEDRVYK